MTSTAAPGVPVPSQGAISASTWADWSAQNAMAARTVAPMADAGSLERNMGPIIRCVPRRRAARGRIRVARSACGTGCSLSHGACRRRALLYRDFYRLDDLPGFLAAGADHERHPAGGLRGDFHFDRGSRLFRDLASQIRLVIGQENFGDVILIQVLAGDHDDIADLPAERLHGTHPRHSLLAPTHQTRGGY